MRKAKGHSIEIWKTCETLGPDLGRSARLQRAKYLAYKEPLDVKVLNHLRKVTDVEFIILGMFGVGAGETGVDKGTVERLLTEWPNSTSHSPFYDEPQRLQTR